MKKLVSFILIISMLLVLVVGCGQNAVQVEQKAAEKVPGVTDTSVKIGLIGDMSGPVVSTIAPYFEGYKAYIQLTNDNGGVNGRKIELSIQDDQYKVDKAVAGFRKLIDEGTFALAEQAGSSQFAALDPEIKEAKIPMFGPVQTTKIQSQNPYTYNINLGYDAQGKIFIKRVIDTYKGTDKPKVAFWGTEGASTLELGGYIKAAAQAAGVPIVQEESIPNGTTELSAQITRAKQAGAQYIVYMGVVSTFVAYLRDAQRLGASDIVMLAGYSGANPTIYENVGKDASKNFYAIQSFNPITSEGSGITELSQYVDKAKVDPKLSQSVSYVQGWTTGKVMVEGLKRAGKNLTREAFMKAIESITDYDTGGLSGKISYSSSNHDGTQTARFFQYDFAAKKIIPVSDYYSSK